MSALLEENSDYQAVKLMRVDWDSQSKDPIVKELGVGHRATLVMFRDGKEVGRVLWSASKSKIEPLFQAAI